MKHFIALAVIFLISVCLSAKNKSSDLGIPNGRPIVIVADWNQPPFFFIDQKNGTPKGYCLDLLTTALDKLGAKYVIKVESWDKSLADLESGKADITCS
ncbi:MAG TPA: transporter substrate-binding domain-containing protein, partial [Xylanibacter oryzae]|nr:transporter substrate-binding domain-containing protein [Xylanibacter oryzae]